VCPRDGGCHELADDPATFGRPEESGTPELIEQALDFGYPGIHIFDAPERAEAEPSALIDPPSVVQVAQVLTTFEPSP
jgi:hypothetical protein